MQQKTSLTLRLAICAALVSVSSCANSTYRLESYPPIADLRDEPKPRLRIEDGESEKALIEHDDAIEAWGERGWAAVGRICRWAKANGLPDPVVCKPPPDS